jgi:hypothetical protein
MEKYHAKSPCCRKKVYRFGKRRRQCSRCQKTWRIRKKKVGRKLKKESSQFALRYLHHEVPSLYAKALASGLSDDKLRTRLVKSRNQLLKRMRWPILPRKKPLIALADAMVCYVDNSWYTFYLIVVKKSQQQYATIARPYVRKGTEVWLGWHEAFKRLPLKTKAAIVALVCDGHIGLVSTAKRENWILQRCHFHLVARLQSRRSKWHLSRHGDEGRLLYAFVSNVMNNTSLDSISTSLERLHEYLQTSPLGELRNIIMGFTKHYMDYRSYLTYPTLNLPRTNNAVESMIGSIRSFCSRARGFRTISALTAWVDAVLKSKQRITCNGFYQPN